METIWKNNFVAANQKFLFVKQAKMGFLKHLRQRQTQEKVLFIELLYAMLISMVRHPVIAMHFSVSLYLVMGCVQSLAVYLTTFLSLRI